jgi:hypothetical protein
LCDTDGNGNYYWLVQEPCPDGCQCRPDMYMTCNEANLGGHSFLCTT